MNFVRFVETKPNCLHILVSNNKYSVARKLRYLNGMFLKFRIKRQIRIAERVLRVLEATDRKADKAVCPKEGN